MEGASDDDGTMEDMGRPPSVPKAVTKARPADNKAAKKRGRPRKGPKKRGRPRKVAVAAEDEKHQTYSDSDIINGTPKGGKGRPKKVKKLINLPEAVNESRNRPMPHSSQSEVEDDEEEDEEVVPVGDKEEEDEEVVPVGDKEEEDEEVVPVGDKEEEEEEVVPLGAEKEEEPSSQTARPPVQSPSNTNAAVQKNNIFETLCATAYSDSITYAEMDEDMEEYNTLTNSELNEQIVALTSEEMKIEVCHVKEDEGEYMEMYEGIQATCFEAETQIAPATYRTGYIKIQPNALRPIEEVGDDGPTTYVCLKGTVHFKTNAIQESEGRVYLKGTQLTVGDTIILPRGIPYSYENRGHSEAKLQYSTLQMI